MLHAEGLIAIPDFYDSFELVLRSKILETSEEKSKLTK